MEAFHIESIVGMGSRPTSIKTRIETHIGNMGSRVSNTLCNYYAGRKGIMGGLISGPALYALLRAIGIEVIVEGILWIVGSIIAIWKGWQEKTKVGQLTNWAYMKYLIVSVLPVTIYNLVVYIYAEMADLAIYIIQDAWGNPIVVEFTGFTGWLMEAFHIESVVGMYAAAYGFRITMKVFRVY